MVPKRRSGLQQRPFLLLRPSCSYLILYFFPYLKSVVMLSVHLLGTVLRFFRQEAFAKPGITKSSNRWWWTGKTPHTGSVGYLLCVYVVIFASDVMVYIGNECELAKRNVCNQLGIPLWRGSVLRLSIFGTEDWCAWRNL